MNPSIAISFKRMNTSQQIKFVENIIKKMSSDIRFRSLLPYTKDLSLKLKEWKVCIADANNGGKIKTIKKIEKGLSIRDKVFHLANQVEILAEHNQDIIVASGYKRPQKVTFPSKAFSNQQMQELLVAMA